MNKELTLLETFELLCRSYVDDMNTLRHKDIEKDYLYNEKYGATITDIKTGRSGKTADIGTALKEYEGAKAHIEALNIERVVNAPKLTAFEIIKKKRVLIDVLLDVDTLKDYNDFKTKEEQLSQEEYDLLKKELKHDR